VRPTALFLHKTGSDLFRFADKDTSFEKQKAIQKPSKITIFEQSPTISSFVGPVPPPEFGQMLSFYYL
jgi:hypothetical protein